MNEFEYTNQKMWDELAPVHYKSYGLERLRAGQTMLDEIQLSEMGDVRGKRLLHLQCHIGSDTLSWAKEGAAVTGVDFSEKSIELAKRLAEELKFDARFICCNIYDIEKHLDEKFDIVYTGQGVLCWLKDLREWARLIVKYLKPGGVFYIMESHPIKTIFEDTQKGPLKIIHPYFHSDQPKKWDDPFPDYTDPTYIYGQPSYEWTWPISDIINALITAGLEIQFLHEFDKTFSRMFPDMEKSEDGWWYLPEYRGKLPLMFTLRAIKN